MSQGRDRIELEVGLKKAIQWIDERRRQDPQTSTTKLIDEASRPSHDTAEHNDPTASDSGQAS